MNITEKKQTHRYREQTKKKQTHRYREQTSGYQWGEGRGKGHDRGGGEWEVQTIGCKTGSRVYCTTQGI